ncbi:MAG: substrate-binding domain-containing protein [Candidatus Zhuqueibacterota bacterium]
MKRITPFILILLSVVLLTDCSRKTDDKEILIGASLLTMQDDFYITLNRGLLETAAKSTDFKIKVLSRNADLKLNKQISDIEDFMQQNIDVLIVSPVSPTAIGPTIDEVNRQGIPVITVDIKSEKGEVKTHIMSDDVEAGRICARFIAGQLNGQGEVGIITHPVLTSCINRVIGFRDVMSNYPGITILSELNAESRREKAMALMEDLLISHPDVDYIFGINDVMTLGAMASIEGAGRIDDVKAVMVCGGQKEAFERFDADDPCLRGAALVFPYSIGKTAIESAIQILKGNETPAEILIPVKLLTHENIDTLSVEWGRLPE